VPCVLLLVGNLGWGIFMPPQNRRRGLLSPASVSCGGGWIVPLTRSWLGFVERMGGLNANETAAWSAGRDFFVSLEKTQTSRSYKIALLLSMLAGDTLVSSLSIEEITRRVAVLAKRIHLLAEDFSVDLSNIGGLQSSLLTIPLRPSLTTEAWEAWHTSNLTERPSPSRFWLTATVPSLELSTTGDRREGTSRSLQR
jgi:hypothetical protein